MQTITAIGVESLIITAQPLDERDDTMQGVVPGREVLSLARGLSGHH